MEPSPRPIIIGGSPTALGGLVAGIERTPAERGVVACSTVSPRSRGSPACRRPTPSMRQMTLDGRLTRIRAEDLGPDLRVSTVHLALAASVASALEAAPPMTPACCSSAATARPTPGPWPACDAPAGTRPSRSPGSTPTATSTPPTRPRRATSGGCRSRCSSAAATMTCSAPATPHPSPRRTRRLPAARSSTRPSPRMLGARGRPFRCRHARDARRPLGVRGVGLHASWPRGSMRRSSPSSWSPSTHRPGPGPVPARDWWPPLRVRSGPCGSVAEQRAAARLRRRRPRCSAWAATNHARSRRSHASRQPRWADARHTATAAPSAFARALQSRTRRTRVDTRERLLPSGSPR